MTFFEKIQTAFGCVNIIILIGTGYFIFRSLKSPIDAVKVGRELNKEQEKDNAKRNLFLLLFSLRGNPLHYDFVRGLNQIDVVFEDTPEVLAAWHAHYDSLHLQGQVDVTTTWNVQRTNLLSAMAVSLGYNRIRQTDMLVNYTPVGHNDQQEFEWNLQQAQMTFYKSSAAMNQRIMERMDDQDSKASDEENPAQ